jgi:hypothetical protein
MLIAICTAGAAAAATEKRAVLVGLMSSTLSQTPQPALLGLQHLQVHHKLPRVHHRCRRLRVERSCQPSADKRMVLPTLL